MGRAQGWLLVGLCLWGCKLDGPASVGFSGDDPNAERSGPARAPTDCATYVDSSVSAARGFGLPITYQPAWALPDALNTSPSGAAFCGTSYYVADDGTREDGPGSLVSEVFASALFGNDLRDFWGPKFEALGCEFAEDTSTPAQTRLRWSCPSDVMEFVSIITDPGPQVFTLTARLP